MTASRAKSKGQPPVTASAPLAPPPGTEPGAEPVPEQRYLELGMIEVPVLARELTAQDAEITGRNTRRDGRDQGVDDIRGPFK